MVAKDLAYTYLHVWLFIDSLFWNSSPFSWTLAVPSRYFDIGFLICIASLSDIISSNMVTLRWYFRWRWMAFAFVVVLLVARKLFCCFEAHIAVFFSAFVSLARVTDRVAHMRW
jgi:hypothetical protein